jgi:hypothetical protein
LEENGFKEELKMSEVYSITGLFYEAFPGISPWGGYFIKGMEGEQENFIAGQLIDIYGPSKLEGILKKDALRFRKQYERCNHEQVFDYDFSLKDGIWQGQYSSPSSYSGISICKTNLSLGDFAFEEVDLSTPEGYAKAAIRSMIRTGVLESFKDEESGEEMIRLKR